MQELLPQPDIEMRTRKRLHEKTRNISGNQRSVC
jgi:hypothetical protein